MSNNTYNVTKEQIDSLFAHVRKSFKNEANDIHESDTKARKVCVQHKELLNEEQQIELANAYLEYIAYFHMKDENKTLISFVLHIDVRTCSYNDIIIKNSRERLNKMCKVIRLLVK
jgi:Zn-dependent M32 family carboxypeptidase